MNIWVFESGVSFLERFRSEKSVPNKSFEKSDGERLCDEGWKVRVNIGSQFLSNRWNE